MSYTLGDLKTLARQKSDQENSDFISDSELTSYINESRAELYDLILSRFEDYYSASATFTVASGAWTYPLPSDFYKLRGIDVDVGGEWATVHKFDFEARNSFTAINRRLQGSQAEVRYRVVGGNIQFLPKDRAPGLYQIWYTPRVTKFVNDTDTIDDVLDFGEFMAVDAAIKCLTKEESDVTDLKMQKDGLRQRILAMTSGRDQNEPERIIDVRRGHMGGDDYL